jgi:hypothetical protein
MQGCLAPDLGVQIDRQGCGYTRSEDVLNGSSLKCTKSGWEIYSNNVKALVDERNS